MYSIIRPLLFKLDPELAHHLVMKLFKLLHLFGFLYFIKDPSKVTPKIVMGLKFKNIVGLAAGLDKNAEYIDCLAKLGFGFIEVGTVTPKPQPGNPKPRSFRLTNEEGIINRFGFNNVGIHQVIKNIKKSSYKGILGINIGKNFNTKIENAVKDYLICFREAYAYASYITINISSPNTKGLRDLQKSKYLEDLLSKIKIEQLKLKKIHKKYVPIAIKISPDNSERELNIICNLLLKYKLDAVIATNTSTSRKEVVNSVYVKEEGGLSGKPLQKKSLTTIKFLYKKLNGKIPIIGVGGILSVDDAKQKIKYGSELIQIYSGLIFKGHRLVHEICRATK
jgi:dihydroorotate dehydrogenase|tara:strand:- start:2461 stop:3471 length:1011 start_codon:yes stop_codon:yes gene_type:complete